MKIFIQITFAILVILLSSCSGNKEKVSVIKEKDLELSIFLGGK